MENQFHKHIFVDTVVPATCQQQGYTLHRCECGYAHKDNFTLVGAHKYEVLQQENSTCVEQGRQVLRCTVCGAPGEQVIPATGHKWDKWTVQTEPTCAEAGKAVRSCETCGAVEEKPIPAADHDWDSWAIQTVPTCTEEGKKGRCCSRCGAVEEKPVKATGHKLRDPKKSTTQKGMVECFCENCGQTVLKPSFAKKTRKWFIGGGIAVALLAALVLVGVLFLKPFYYYTMGKLMLRWGKYDKAYYNLQDYIKCMDEKNAKAMKKLTPNERRKAEDHTEAEKYQECQELLEDFYVLCGTYTSTRYLENGEKRTTKTQEEYDADTNTIIETEYYSDGTIANSWGRTYDAAGNLLSEIECDQSGGIIEKTEYTYDAAGNLLSEVTYDRKGRVISKEGYTYDAAGNLLSWSREGEITYKEEYTYDAAGNELSCVRYDAKGEITWKYEYTYDAAGNKLSYVQYDAEGDIENKKEWTYDADGNELSNINYNAEGKIKWKYEYTYDDDKNLVCREAFDENGELSGVLKYQYDKKGNNIGMTNYNAAGEIIGKGEYEEKGNVYIATIYEEGKKTEQYQFLLRIPYQSDDAWNYYLKGAADKILWYKKYAPNGRVVVEKEWKYDEHGNLVRYEIYQYGELLEKEEYEDYQIIYLAAGSR